MENLWKTSKANFAEKRTKERGLSIAWEKEIADFKKGDMKYPLSAESYFEVIYPSYREKYLKEIFCVVQKVLKDYGIKAELDVLLGRMSVRTTKNTWDPCIILKAKGVISLLGRSVPVEEAIRILNDKNTYEIIPLRSNSGVKEKFVKRRELLRGPEGNNHKALQHLTNCYILIQGKTVAAIGPYKGVQQVLKVVQKVMNGKHPLHLLTELNIKRKLAADEKNKDANWADWIPVIKKKNVKRKVPHKIRKKKEYVPFPPEMKERIEDQEMNKGKRVITDKSHQRKKRQKTK